MGDRSNRGNYNKEFKKKTVHLVLEECYKAAEVERNLDIGSNIVSRWFREAKEDNLVCLPWESAPQATRGEVSSF